MTQKGEILIVTLWILTILSLMAVGVGFRMGLEIKLTGLNVSEFKALYLAKAAIRKAIAVRYQELMTGKTKGIDALSHPWSNDEENFKEFKMGEGSFTLSYSPKDMSRSGKEILLYGMEDESGRININSKKMEEPLKILLINNGLELDDAGQIAAAITDWRDEDSVPAFGGAEDEYYQGLEKPYRVANREFKIVEELLLVKGVTEKLFYGEDRNNNKKIDPDEEGIAEYLTVFGEGEVNINTAPEAVLDAVFGAGYSDIAGKIVDYRKGFDGKIGTGDDRWFAKGSSVAHKEELGRAMVKNLKDKSWGGNIYGITEREWERIQKLVGEGALVSESNIFRFNITCLVRAVKKKITAVVELEESKSIHGLPGFGKSAPPPEIRYLYWHEI